MTVYKSKPVEQINNELLPMHFDQFGVPSEKYIERATYTRSVCLMSWHPHVVAEGMARADDMNLKRALVDEGVSGVGE